jgi:DNA-binding NtrC family response regulator
MNGALPKVDLSRFGTIVVIEREPMILNLLQRIFESQAYLVYAFGSAGQALRWMEGSGILADILICDFRSPGISGEELITAVYSLNQDIKLLFLNESPAESNPDAAHFIPHDWQFLPKPFGARALLKMVRAMLKEEVMAD